MSEFYNKSSCCGAPLTVSTADEGTSCYICTQCDRPCDASSEDRFSAEGTATEKQDKNGEAYYIIDGYRFS